MYPIIDFDPAIFRLGPLQVRWYGLMYVLGFIVSYLLVKRQINKFNLKTLATHYENLNLVLIISLIVGGRLGYVLFYNFPYYLGHPAEILATWKGGMSFHGALIGLLVSGLAYCHKYRLGFWQTADIYVVTAPVGIGLGRLGNFINGELYGRPATVPWAMIFPEGGLVPRHPSQLYESFLEGGVLFVLLWFSNNQKLPAGSMLAFFLILYGEFRYAVEFFREPDLQLGFIFSFITMGQILSFLMISAGLVLLLARRKKSIETIA